MHVVHGKTGCKCGDPTSHPDIVAAQTQVLDNANSDPLPPYTLLPFRSIGSDIIPDVLSVLEQNRTALASPNTYSAHLPGSDSLKPGKCELQGPTHLNTGLENGAQSVCKGWMADIAHGISELPTAQDMTLSKCADFANRTVPSVHLLSR